MKADPMGEPSPVTETMDCAREWEVCVERELCELQDRVSERVRRRVTENIRRTELLRRWPCRIAEIW